MSYPKCLLMASFVFSSYGYADCPSEYKEIALNYYSPERLLWDGLVCETWPATGLFIVATAIKSADGIDMGIAVIDPMTKKVVASIREVDMLDSTAIYNTAILIDAAGYRLNTEVVAFGIRTSWTGSSIPNPYDIESLNLYALNGSSLDKVLSDLTTQEKSGEWDTVCEGSFVTRRMTLAIAPSTNKYSDINVEEKVASTQSKTTEGDCISVLSKTETELYSIKYSNGFYMVPQKLRSFIQSN